MDQVFGSDPGEEALDVANALYPGTTPFERLQAGGGGAAAAGASQAAAQKQFNAAMRQQDRQANLKEKEIEVGREVNERQQNIGLLSTFLNNMTVKTPLTSTNPFVNSNIKEISDLFNSVIYNGKMPSFTAESVKKSAEKKRKQKIDTKGPDNPGNQPKSVWPGNINWGSSF